MEKNRKVVKLVHKLLLRIRNAGECSDHAPITDVATIRRRLSCGTSTARLAGVVVGDVVDAAPDEAKVYADSSFSHRRCHCDCCRPDVTRA